MPATRRSATTRTHDTDTPIRRLSSTSGSTIVKADVHRVPLVTHDYRADPRPFPALKTEQGVFTTPPYSAEIKGLWRFKNEATATESADALWEKFEKYRDTSNFVGMDISRKFIQMGRTRSLRYALREGGKKYSTAKDGSKQAMKRTGKVYDEEKLKGANVFEGYLDRCWADEEYKRAFERWRKGERWDPDGRQTGGAEKRVDDGEGVVKHERMDDGDEVKPELVEGEGKVNEVGKGRPRSGSVKKEL